MRRLLDFPGIVSAVFLTATFIGLARIPAKAPGKAGEPYAERSAPPVLIKFEGPRTGPRCMVGKLAGWNSTPPYRIIKLKQKRKLRA
jgi:hypothetical protein